jgi:hypothetical protein
MSTQSNTFTRMPGPRSRDAPRFTGKRIIRFLADYEYCADAAGLTPEQRILQITRYCDIKSEEFIESLDEYGGKDWPKLKKSLLDCYPSEEEKPYYKVDDLLKFVRKDRKLPTIEKFDEYFRQFSVIAKSLEARQALSETDKHDYFWRGIKPPTFREEIAIAMKNAKLWTDLTNPPPMTKVKEMIKQRLKRDLYRVNDDDGKYADGDESQGSPSENSSDESDPSDSESEREYRRMRAKRRHSKHDVRTKKDGPAPKATETKAPEPPEPPKSNIDDLAEKIGRLTIALGQFDNDKVPRRSVRFAGSILRCFMCGENGHAIKECPESKAFIAKKVLKITNEGRLVQADGSDLPYGDMDNGGVARVLREQIANASNAETEYLQEFLSFNDYEYEVFPAEREQEVAPKSKRSEPYNKDDRKGKSPQRPNRAYIELPSQRSQSLPTKSTDQPVPKILTRGASNPELPEGPAAVTDRDTEMRDITPESTNKDERDQTKPGKIQNKSQSKEKDKVPPDDVVIRDKSDFTKKRASPAYRFASELQEDVDIENLFKSIMDKEIPVKIGDVLGSSFELCRRLQMATKTQRIPVAQATVAIPNPSTNKRIRTQVSHLEVDLDDTNDETNQRNSGHFLRERPRVRIRNAEVDSDDENDDESNVSEPMTNTDDEAEMHYQRLLENEHKRLFYVQATDYSVRPSFLAMVTAKIQGTIMKYPCTMLIDSGSELNMMAQSIQERLELPLDPSGADWLLRGVSGHQVRLVGLCRNVPLQVGGIPFPHNFFVTSDNMGQKGIILGQPWLFSYSARLDYTHNVGMNLQVWQEGDRDGGQSVRVALPIMTAPRNVLPIEAIKRQAKRAGVNAIVVEKANDLDEIPQYFKSVNSIFGEDLNFKKLRPHATTSKAVVHSLDLPPIQQALHRAYFTHDVIRNDELSLQLTKVMTSEEYSLHQSSERPDSITRFILRNYKPVRKKAYHVASYNPGSRPLELKFLEFNPVNLTKIEDVEYTSGIADERLDLITDCLLRSHQTGGDSKESRYDSDIDEGIKIVAVPNHSLHDYDSKSSDDDDANNPQSAAPIWVDHMTRQELTDHMAEFILQHTKLKRLSGESILKCILWGGRSHQVPAFRGTVRKNELRPHEVRIFELEPQNIYTKEAQPLVLECNMMERQHPQYPNSHRPYDHREHCQYASWNVEYSRERRGNSRERNDEPPNKSPKITDVTYAIKDVLLRVHNDSFSLNDYFVVTNELLRGALTAMAQEIDRSDPRFAAFKLNVQSLFHQWNDIFPIPSYSNAWATEIINIIGEKKDRRTNEATQSHSASISATPFAKSNEPNSIGGHQNIDEPIITKRNSKGKRTDTSSRSVKPAARDRDSAEAYMLAGQSPTTYRP